MTEVKLPSGAILKITPAPFADARALYQAVLEELKQVPFNSKREISEVIKDITCLAFSSKGIEAALMKCFERCTYNSGKGDFRINADTFEPMEAREDYMAVCVAVAKENILPFVKSLYAEYEHILQMIQSDPT